MSNEEKILDATAPMPIVEPDVAPEDGDAYDDDTGIYLGNLDGGEEIGRHTIQEIAVFMDGWWYVFKRDRRYKDE